ncbi:S-layer homology domain-containing protein [Ureibacillus thermosphaericus]|uniref:S-layer homology domain-containing protein n=1 Tax=Ureibacillus thermosphaericus TaxID=51173 RepID=UPI000BBCD963|nr:S-layer homology domain-containing protein [Ureibacillus thermosphaericus]
MKFKKKIAASIAACLIAAGAMSASANELPFKDIKADDFYIEPLKKFLKFDYVKGFDDNTFRPYQNVNRAQAASFVARTMGLDLENVKDPGFKDVPKQYGDVPNPHYGAIAKLTELGVFDKGKYFKPGEEITRAEMAKILVKAYELEAPTLKRFSDVPENDENYSYIGTIGSLGITVNEGLFKPNDGVGRAHLITFIARTIDLKRSDDKEDYWDTLKGWDDNEDSNENNKENNNDNGDQGGNEQVDDYIQLEVLKKEIEFHITDLRDARKEVEKQLEKLNDVKKDIGDIKEIEEEIQYLKKQIDKKKSEKEKEEKRKEVDKQKIRDIERKIDELEDELEELEDLIEEYEIQKNKLSQALKNLDSIMNNAEKILQTAKEKYQKELDQTIISFAYDINRAKRDHASAYAKTFDKDYYEELGKKTKKDLEKVIDKGKKVLKSNVSLNELKSKLIDLNEAIMKAEDAYDSMKDAGVDLKTLENELKDLIKTARSLSNDIEKEIDKKEDNREDYFKAELKDSIDELEDAIKELERAVKDKKGVTKARGNVSDAIEDAEKVLKNYRDSGLKSLQKYEDQLKDLIKKGNDLFKSSKELQ